MAYLMFAILLFAVLMVAIPKDVRQLLSENSRNRHGKVKWRYLSRELRAVANFFSGIFFFALVIGFAIALVLIMVDSYVIPSALMSKAIDQADPNPQQWKENLTTGLDSVKNDYEQWHVTQGGTKESARPWMRFMWVSLPFAILGAFGLIVVTLRVTSSSYRRSLNDLVTKASQRNLTQIRRRYLSKSRQRNRHRKVST